MLCYPEPHRRRRTSLSALATPGVERIRTLILVLGLLSATYIHAAEVIPPKPPGYFNDNANVVSRETALRLNEQLAQFERETSNQLLIAIYPKMETDSDIADYTQRVAQAWGVGQADRRNGAVLFVFIQDRKMFIQVGYGLEGAIPDLTAFDITERRIKPRFKANDYEGGLTIGVESMMKAAVGEYTGTGRTVAESGRRKTSVNMPCIFLFLFFILFLIMSGLGRKKRRRGWIYTGGGGPFIGGGGWGGGSSGGGFSGFSGGGGSFGGGGGGSSW
ncbi:TPM domain-containing protein [soil metagenome]